MTHLTEAFLGVLRVGMRLFFLLLWAVEIHGRKYQQKEVNGSRLYITF